MILGIVKVIRKDSTYIRTELLESFNKPVTLAALHQLRPGVNLYMEIENSQYVTVTKQYYLNSNKLYGKYWSIEDTDLYLTEITEGVFEK